MKIKLLLLLILLKSLLLSVSCDSKSKNQSANQSTLQASVKEASYPSHRDVEVFLQRHVSEKSEGILAYSSSVKTDGKSKDESSYTMYVTVDCTASEGCAMNGEFDAMKWTKDPKRFSTPDPSMYPVILTTGQHAVTKLAIDLEKRESGWTVTNIKMIR